MFEYSCSATHLTNWVFSQVTDQPGAVFPKRKGWSFYLKTFYPAGSDRSMLMVMAANNAECVVFLPVDDNIDQIQIKNAVKQETLKTLRTEFKRVTYQSILLTCEKQQERVLQILKEKNSKTPLLVLSSEQVTFSTGNFDNPRLEFRLSQLDYDPDLIPGFIHDSRLRSLENVQKSLYYQHFFHLLNRHWLKKENHIPLRQIVSRSVPCWSHFRRIDQKTILQQVNSELQVVFEQFFDGMIWLDIYKKKTTSQPEVILMLSDPPESKKSVSTWGRKQKQALEFLNESRKPLSIEELELFIN